MKAIHTEMNGILFWHKVSKHSETMVTFKYICKTKNKLNQIGKKYFSFLTEAPILCNPMYLIYYAGL